MPLLARLRNSPDKTYVMDHGVRYGKLYKKLIVVLEAGLKAFDFDAEVRVRKQLGG